MKLIGRILIFIFCLTIVIPLSAQRQRRHTVVTNDGTRFMGTIISDTSGYIKVRIKSPRVILLPRKEIDTVVGNELFFRNQELGRGYYIHISASNMVRSSEPGNTNAVSLHFSNGYQFRNGLSIGAGSGLDYFDGIMIPAYSMLRYQPFKRRVSPYVWAKAGYSFSTPDMAKSSLYWSESGSEHSGGPLVNAGFGIELYSWNKNSICFGAGYRYQKSSVSNYYNFRPLSTRYDYYTEFNRLEIQIGFVFR
jgi:hypothetical protein